ncbi:hypothetical protein Bca52824_087019 [Brassica carinata]|uniref:Uncharacterized protein n=1 Tax=Brassica carinata TaxID=52824 RepID=A0A8X7P8X3_BRACI|nr:hypothetical protein Bca52824_087019 [Brassica carinata]
MISWGPNNNATDVIKNQTKGKIRLEITISPRGKISNFKRKNKMTKICELLEKPIALQIQNTDRMQTLNRNLSGGQRHYRPALTKRWKFPAHDKGKKRIDFIYGGSKFYNSVNSIKGYQRRAGNNVGVREPLSGPDHEITFDENETTYLD